MLQAAGTLSCRQKTRTKFPTSFCRQRMRQSGTQSCRQRIKQNGIPSCRQRKKQSGIKSCRPKIHKWRTYQEVNVEIVAQYRKGNQLPCFCHASSHAASLTIHDILLKTYFGTADFFPMSCSICAS